MKIIPKKGGLNINLIFTTFIIVFGSSFLFGYNIGVLNQPADLIRQFYTDTYQARNGNETVPASTITLAWSLTTALFIPGGMIGAFLGGYLADSLGRKRTILLSHLFTFIGSALSTACVAAGSPELLMIGRVFVGINSGLGNCIAPMFLSEVAPFNYRGAFGTLHQLFVTFGIFLSSVFGLQQLLGTPTLWPYLILLEFIPALVSLVILPFLPETPRFLLLVQKDRDGATEALKFYRKTDDVDTDMEEMDTEHQATSVSSGEVEQHHSFTMKQLVTSVDLRRPLFVACFLQVIQQFSGINAVFFYSKSIFESAKVRADHIPYAIIGTNAVNVFMTVIAVPLMDLAGRRPLLLIPMVVMIVDLILMTICRVLQANDPTIAGLAYVTIACVIIYVIAFAVGLGPIPMMIGAELFRQGPRPKAMAVASAVNWVGTFIIAMSFESIQNAAGDYTFIIFIVLLIGFVVFTYFYVPETKNKTFEEIAHQFSPGDQLEVEELEEFPDIGDIADGEGLEHDDHQLVTLNFDKEKESQANEK